MKGSEKFYGKKLVEHFLNMFDYENLFPKHTDFSQDTSIYFKKHSLGHDVLKAANLIAAFGFCKLP